MFRAYMFLYGLLSFVSVDLVVRLYGNEVLALVFFIFSLPVLFRTGDVLYRMVFLGYFFVFLGFTIADILNESSFGEFLRGASNPLMGFICFNVLYLCASRDWKSINYFFVGGMFGALFFLFSVEFTGDLSIFIKTGVVSLLFFSIFVFLGQDKILVSLNRGRVVLLVGLSLVVLGARSAGLILVTAVIFLHVSRSFNDSSFLSKSIAASFFLLFVYLAFLAYVYLSLLGYTSGNTDYQIKLMSNPWDPLEWIIYGRTDFAVGLRAFSDALPFGFGSWAIDQYGVYEAYELSFTGGSVKEEVQLIRGHSVLLTAGIWGGLIGVLGVLLLLFVCLNYLKYQKYFSYSWSLIFSILFFVFVWSFFFSPIGHIRVSFPYVLALMIVAFKRCSKVSKARR